MAPLKSTSNLVDGTNIHNGITNIKAPVPAQIFNARLRLLPKYTATILFAYLIHRH